jgi:Pyocin activator protein PrtN
MNTAFILLAQYDGLAVIPLDAVCRDYFQHLTPEKLARKALAGEIAIPIVRIEASQKATKGVHVNDLAAYLDKQAEAARRECAQINSSNPAA